MPEHLRALVVLLGIAVLVFTLWKSAACSLAISEKDYNRRKNLWLYITLVGFLSHNFWLYVCITGILVIFAALHEKNHIALYFYILFTMPMITDMISIFYFNLFEIDYSRLLSLTILIPAFFRLRKTSKNLHKIGFYIQDKLLLIYLGLLLVLNFQADTGGNVFRYYILYPFLSVFLPYYVASRSLKNREDFRDALMSLVTACMVLSVVAVFECGRHWLLYTALKEALGVPWDFGKYLGRGDFLRALGTPGQAIALGYALAVGLGTLLYFKKFVGNSMYWRLGLSILVAGLVAALSRGPWMGAIAMVFVFIMTGPQVTPKLSKLLGSVLAVTLIASVTPVWDKFINYLPFIGTIDEENVEFRENLLTGVWKIILENPMFGSREPDLEQFRTGEGIIDIVNTYLIIGLESGLTGLVLFISFFLTICWGILQGMRSIKNKDDEKHLLGRTLLAVLIGILVIIFTVSSITVIPYIYWTMAGIGVAYIRFIKQEVPGRPQNEGMSIPA